ncbi:hypothetical protein IMG5_104680 [Ichthyophthirius multifiliis]|uniref:Furin n=1 Tax=Ichthyophthirius multifiliis TaxID=5932 RepID=G0QSY4_ICHMU|nr:hypothetical protein IMG5_104680 [Ichthyophthirius multifiliis]EGR31672.1 hypothetical protein IMG5_104680 [Ichthyophthirius multifiliis]|eukprot:XP_004035158.1 hypothetical protein IMG5_104680 [Ichthyophthirius multifiliis]
MSFWIFRKLRTQACEKLSQGCLQQDNPNTCSQCDTNNGFRLTLEKKCTLCQLPCSLCNPNKLTQCFVCEERELTDEIIETQCPQQCERCSQPGECLECKTGYYQDQAKIHNIDETTEIECPNECKKCSKSKICLECQDGFYDYSFDNPTIQTIQCLSCTIKFSKCSSCTPSICLKCFPGYEYYDYEEKCIEVNKDATDCNQGCTLCGYNMMILKNYYEYYVNDILTYKK